MKCLFEAASSQLSLKPHRRSHVTTKENGRISTASERSTEKRESNGSGDNGRRHRRIRPRWSRDCPEVREQRRFRADRPAGTYEHGHRWQGEPHGKNRHRAYTNNRNQACPHGGTGRVSPVCSRSGFPPDNRSDPADKIRTPESKESTTRRSASPWQDSSIVRAGTGSP